MIPAEVLRRAEQELCNWHGLGTSVMEISHRSKEFIQVAEESEKDIRDLLNIPQNYKVLFCHGGARAQFAAVPMNLLGDKSSADYIDGGYWAHSAVNEAKKYCTPNVIDVTTNLDGKRGILPMSEWKLNADSAYVHYCPNETIDGVSIDEMPDFGDKIVVADYSSCILSRPIDVSRFGVIYAGAQKNIGPAGLTLVIVREDLLGQTVPGTPTMFDYKTQADNDSMYNTPPTYAIYIAGLVFKMLKAKGGLAAMEQANRAKAKLLYDFLDTSKFFLSPVARENRSLMNIPFTLKDAALDAEFLKGAEARGMIQLKGHRTVGGIRASIYNAMPVEGVQALADYMKEFEKTKA